MALNKNITWERKRASELGLNGMKVAIVGGTGGLGRAISRLMASKGAEVTVVGQTFRDSDMRSIKFIEADLSLMREAERVADLLPAEKLDMVIFTNGIFAAPQRQETDEGLERDMAVSYLSRLEILRKIEGRLGKERPNAKSKPRVFIMGYPGSGQAGKTDDLNAEKSYKAMEVHMNTVAGNEMLVLNYAKNTPAIGFYGLNPGLIKTNIRSNFLGGKKKIFAFVEWLIGVLSPTPDEYAEAIVPLLVSPDIERHSGAHFNRKGQAIMPSKDITPGHTKQFLSASERLINHAKSSAAV